MNRSAPPAHIAAFCLHAARRNDRQQRASWPKARGPTKLTPHSATGRAINDFVEPVRCENAAEIESPLNCRIDAAGEGEISHSTINDERWARFGL